MECSADKVVTNISQKRVELRESGLSTADESTYREENGDPLSFSSHTQMQ
jgi:hypothetical protein